MAFIEHTPTRESCWRSIVLMGLNVASYKFALAQSLIELSEVGQEYIPLDKLAIPFSKNLREHLKHSDKQITASRDRQSFLDMCRQANSGEISETTLVDATVRLGFNNVIDAFHVVNRADTPIRFFNDDRKTRGGITLTDEFFHLSEGTQFKNLPNEVEARWNLVETAWELNLSSNLIHVEYDTAENLLYVPRRDTQRVDVTSGRDALNGYQKGKCFYCFDDISINSHSSILAEVDHFLPHILKTHLPFLNLDGVWNLVLACQSCNRSKNARVPTKNLLERLNTRNNFLIESHHPLRETLIMQTGSNTKKRESFLQGRYDAAVDILIHSWEPDLVSDIAF